MRRLIPILALAVTLTACAGWQQPAETTADTAEALCTNTLLRSEETQRMLLDSGVLPESVPPIVEAACAALPGVQALIEQADRQRSPRARVLLAAARARGLL
jgi:hypothetical protein